MAAPQGEEAHGRYGRWAFLSVISSLPCVLLLLGHYGGWLGDSKDSDAHPVLGMELSSEDQAIEAFPGDGRDLNTEGAVVNASEGPRRPPVHRVVYVKTHATGSSTLTNIFHRLCDVYRLQCFSCGKRSPQTHVDKGWEIDGLTFRKQHLEEVLANGWELDVWPNHAVFVPELFERIIPNSVKVSSFREPKSRIISMLAHEKKVISKAIRGIQRGQHFRCGAHTWLMSDQIGLQEFHALDFVLLTEKYHLSLVMMRRRFGWRFADILYAPIKVSKRTYKERATLMELIKNPGSEAVRRSVDSIFECTEGDGNETHLYKLAQAKFQEQLDSFGAAEQPSLLEEVTLFEATLKELWGCCDLQRRDPYCTQLRLDDGRWYTKQDPASRRRATSGMSSYLASQCWQKLPAEFK